MHIHWFFRSFFITLPSFHLYPYLPILHPENFQAPPFGLAGQNTVLSGFEWTHRNTKHFRLLGVSEDEFPVKDVKFP
jgi:hypothetical protein